MTGRQPCIDPHQQRVHYRYALDYQALAYYAAATKVGAPAEMHLYAQGGHAFGLRHTENPITDWPRLVESWLHTNGMTPEQRR